MAPVIAKTQEIKEPMAHQCILFKMCDARWRGGGGRRGGGGGQLFLPWQKNGTEGRLIGSRMCTSTNCRCCLDMAPRAQLFKKGTRLLNIIGNMTLLTARDMCQFVHSLNRRYYSHILNGRLSWRLNSSLSWSVRLSIQEEAIDAARPAPHGDCYHMVWESRSDQVACNTPMDITPLNFISNVWRSLGGGEVDKLLCTDRKVEQKAGTISEPISSAIWSHFNANAFRTCIHHQQQR